MRIEQIEAIPFRLPLKHVLSWGADGRMAAQEHVLVRVRLAGGAVGIAEAIPRPTIYGETQASITHIIDAVLAPLLVGHDVRDRSGLEALLGRVPWNPSARAAIDMAAHDALARAQDLPLASLLGGAPAPVRISYMIGLGPPAEAVEEALAIREETGITAFKVKAGRNGEDDIARIRLLREALGPDAFLFVDANEQYTPHQALDVLGRMAEFGIAMAEEPIPRGLGARRRDCASRLPVPILADDSVATIADTLRECTDGAVGVIGIKIARTGFLASRRISDLATAHGLPCWIGSQGVSGIGTLGSAHFFGAVRHAVPFPADLGTFLRQEDDLLDTPPRIRDGYLEVPDGAGLGAAVDEAKLARYRADA